MALNSVVSLNVGSTNRESLTGHFSLWTYLRNFGTHKKNFMLSSTQVKKNKIKGAQTKCNLPISNQR